MKILAYLKANPDASLAAHVVNTLQSQVPDARFAAAVFRNPTAKELARHNSLQVDRLLVESEVFEQALQEPLNPDNELLNRWDQHLREHGRGIWSHVTTNRWLSYKRFGDQWSQGLMYSREQTLAIVSAYVAAFEQLIDDFSPDVIWYVNIDVGTPGSDVLNFIARQRGIPVIVAKPLRLGGRYFLGSTVLSRDPHLDAQYENVRRQGEETISDEAEQLLAKMKKGALRPAYMSAVLSQQSRGGFAKSVHAVKQYAQRSAQVIKRAISDDPFLPGAVETEASRVLQEVNRIRAKRTLKFESSVIGEKYFYFPLHVQPELSVELFAPDYNNQPSLIRQLAQCVPADVVVYVKDHPAFVGRRSMAFYDEIASIPNVRLLEPLEDSISLVANSLGVATITGTAGLEALLMGRPVIAWGDVFYSVVESSVFGPRLPHELRQLTDELSRGFEPNWGDVRAFCQAMIDVSFDINVQFLPRRLRESERTGSKGSMQEVENFSELLIERMQARGL